ncbi:MAG: serine hydrolase domain-containing protein [Bacteroidota bacterium]
MHRLVKKISRGFLFFILGVVLILNIFILLSGRYYLYPAIVKTYFHGATGPGIYDLSLFNKTTVKSSSQNFKWIDHPQKNKYNFSEKRTSYHNDYGTKAFLIIKNDSLLFEKYFEEHTDKTVSNSFSGSKTIISLLIGIAIDEGYIKSLDEPVCNYIPEFQNLGRNLITIRHLLLMASGLDWAESTNPTDDAAEGYYTDDLYGLITRQLAIEKPGVRFNYQSGNTQILSILLSKATKVSLTKYTEDKLWKPIGASSQAYWTMDCKGGIERSFCCFYATAKDYALLGRLLLNQGNWNGKQLISKKYMEELIKTPKLKTDEGILNQRYGLHTWVYYNKGNPVYYYRGFKGQYILTIPKDNLIIVRLGTEWEPNFNIPSTKKNDKKFIAENLDKVGHTMDFLKYIEDAYSIVNKLK